MSKLRQYIPAFLLFLFMWANFAGAADLKAAKQIGIPGPDCLVLRTPAGDLLFDLYPSAAPETVKQIITLVRAGLYDGVSVFRIEPAFVAQLATVYDRATPLTEKQKALLHPLRGEFSQIPHVRGVLSMAREDHLPNSAESSFSILLTDAPHLDGKYAIFGKLRSGDDVLRAIEKIQIDPKTHHPLESFRITQAEIVAAKDVASLRLAGARQVAPRPASTQDTQEITPSLGPTEILVFLLLIVGLALVIALWGAKLDVRVSASIALLIALLAAFLGYAVAAGSIIHNEILGGRSIFWISFYLSDAGAI
jgi:cyclophilin family peptidyl-prolyl cis-trans isomerase